MKVVVTTRSPLTSALLPRLLAAGHDVRVLRGHLHEGVPRGVRPLASDTPLRAALRPGDAVVHTLGRLGHVDPHALACLRRVATHVEGTGAHLLVVSTGDPAAVESALASTSAPWTLQAVTTPADDLDGLLAARVRGGRLPVEPTEVQPVDPDEVAARVVAVLRAGPVGRVPDFGGPEPRPLPDLARAWVAATAAETAIEPVAGPLEGAWTAPERAVAFVSWEDWLREHRSRPDPLEPAGHACGADPVGL